MKWSLPFERTRKTVKRENDKFFFSVWRPFLMRIFETFYCSQLNYSLVWMMNWNTFIKFRAFLELFQLFFENFQDFEEFKALSSLSSDFSSLSVSKPTPLLWNMALKNSLLNFMREILIFHNVKKYLILFIWNIKRPGMPDRRLSRQEHPKIDQYCQTFFESWTQGN